MIPALLRERQAEPWSLMGLGKVGWKEVRREERNSLVWENVTCQVNYKVDFSQYRLGRDKQLSLSTGLR